MNISAELKGLLISIGLIAAGNIIVSKNKDIGNMIGGFGIGIGIGTFAHCLDQDYPSPTPHHDATALASLPLIFIADKTNVIKNKDTANKLYGLGLGVLSQHLLTEGCSICGNHYCRNGETLC